MRGIQKMIVAVIIVTANWATAYAAAERGRVEIPFSINRSGFIIIKTKISQKDVSFIIDSGAQANLLDDRYIKPLNLKATEGEEKLFGLGGDGIPLKSVSIPAMRFNKATYEGVPYYALDLKRIGKGVGVSGLGGFIGIPFLTKHGAIIDYKKKTISLLQPGALNTKKPDDIRAEVKGKNRSITPLSFSPSGHMFIPVKVNNKATYLGVDTAASINFIGHKQAKQFGLKLTKSPGMVSGIEGRGVPTQRTQIPKLTVNNTNYKNLPFSVIDVDYAIRFADGNTPSGVIGSPFLRKYGAVINYQDNTISFDAH